MTIPPTVLWPYAAAAAALLAGLFCKARRFKAAGRLEVFIVLAPILIAIGMAVFGADHLSAVRGVASIVPKWIPFPVFWAAFVGVALVAAAAGLATGFLSETALGLLGFMVCCFALIMFAPLWVKTLASGKPGQRVWLTLMVRDLTLSWCYLAAWASLSAKGFRATLVTVGQYIVAIGIGIYGGMQLQHPEMAPGIPQEGPPLPLPGWIPVHEAWTYATGIIFLVGALGLLFRPLAARAAMLLGITCTVLSVLIYLPVTIHAGKDVDNGLNYLAITCVLAGGLLLLSTAFPKKAG